MTKPNLFLAFALICMSFFAVASKPDEDTQVYFKVDPFPAFTYNGISNTGEALESYFSERVVMPEKKLENYIFGKIYIQFIVEKDGSLSQVKLLHGVHRHLDRLAMEAVKSMPRWTPGVRDGKVVRTWFAVAVKWSVKKNQ